jgi:phosphoribosyl 1,2-cyclic phosphate phosphodiesterase
MKATLTVLGSGTSMGVPTIGCDCRVCTSSDPHDQRTRPSAALRFDSKVVVIDTTPDFRMQALREKLTRLDAVLYTHGHADHILGLDDARPLTYRHESNVPLYADEATAVTIERIFEYIFDEHSTYAMKARVKLHRLNGPFEFSGATITPLRVLHGQAPITAYRFGSAAYITDCSSIPPETMGKLGGLDVLFLDALRRRPHPSHASLEEAMRMVEQIGPRRAFFIHMSHDLAHEETNRTLPENMRLAYDGLKVEFEL